MVGARIDRWKREREVGTEGGAKKWAFARRRRYREVKLQLILLSGVGKEWDEFDEVAPRVRHLVGEVPEDRMIS